MPAVLLASQAPAAAAAGKRLAHGQVSVAIIHMTPQEAVPGATITVTGTVTNNTRRPISSLSVELLASSMPLSPSAELQPGSTAQDGLASTPVPNGTWVSHGALQPGITDPWSVRVKANSFGMTNFGVYPLTAQAQTTLDPLLAATTTYLPYTPAKKGPYGSTIPARTKIAWVLPLIDKPLLGQPWQSSCAGAQAEALAASLRSGGRLGQLIDAGGDSMGTADAYSAAAGSGRSAQNGAIRSEQAQSMSSYDGVTWAVDPALLANVKALADCGSQPRWASAARSWLAKLQQVTAAEPMFVTPYANPDVAALVSNGFTGDVDTSFALGREIGQQILHRNLGSLTDTARSSGAQSQAAGIAWPADGISGYSTAEPLVAQDSIQTLLLSSSALPTQKSTVLQALNSVGGYLNILLTNDPLTRLLAAGGSTAGSTFASAQDFLAQTALAAQQDHQGAPVIVAPPQRFDPATGLTTELLGETATAPWLSPVSLTSLTSGNHIPHVGWAAFTNSAARISRHELRKLRVVDSGITQLNDMAAHQDNNLSLAAATIESSAWQGKSRATAQAMLAAVISKINQQERGVQIYAEPRVTLGGLKGSVPVSIDNRLGFAIRVRLKLQSQAAGVSFTPSPDSLVTVQAHTAMTVQLKVQATAVGSSNVTMSLVDQGGQTLQSQTMTVEATQVGVLGAIIGAAAIGVLLIAYAARAVRRGHPGGGAADPADPGPAPDQGSDPSTEPAEPDTVMAERTELGTAGAPGP